MIHAFKYNVDTGLIIGRIVYQEGTEELQCSVGEALLPVSDGHDLGSTHVVAGAPIVRASHASIDEIKALRNALLAACDWTQVPDVPLSEQQKLAWAAYRQELRDFPAICDPANPVWPVPPT